MIFEKTKEKDDRIYLSDGKEGGWFTVLDGASLFANEYAALLEEETDEVVILKVIMKKNKEAYETVEDDKEFEAVEKLFEKLFEEE